MGFPSGGRTKESSPRREIPSRLAKQNNYAFPKRPLISAFLSFLLEGLGLGRSPKYSEEEPLIVLHLLPE